MASIFVLNPQLTAILRTKLHYDIIISDAFFAVVQLDWLSFEHFYMITIFMNTHFVSIP